MIVYLWRRSKKRPAVFALNQTIVGPRGRDVTVTGGTQTRNFRRVMVGLHHSPELDIEKSGLCDSQCTKKIKDMKNLYSFNLWHYSLSLSSTLVPVRGIRNGLKLINSVCWTPFWSWKWYDEHAMHGASSASWIILWWRRLYTFVVTRHPCLCVYLCVVTCAIFTTMEIFYYVLSVPTTFVCNHLYCLFR